MLFDQGSLFVLFSNISLLFLLSMCIHYKIVLYSVFLAGPLLALHSGCY